MDSALASRFMQSRLPVTGSAMASICRVREKKEGAPGLSADFPGGADCPETQKTQNSMDANSPMTSPTTAVKGDKPAPCSQATR